MDRAIRGATKPKNAAPKKKYLDILIPATTSDISLQEMLVALHHRLKEQPWTVVFKSLIVIHILMRQGTNDNVLKYLASEPNIMNVSRFKDKSGPHHQAKNIHAYAAYLDEKIGTYRELRFDLAKTNSQPGVAGRLRKLTVAKGLLREVKILQRQMGALLKCKFFLDEINNEVTLTAFKLLVKDLLALFQAVNEGVINVLEQYCEMSLVDARDALAIYKEFVKQTEGVVDFLSVAKKLQNELKMTIPNLKHAPVSMTNALEEYVNDPDFEKNREDYKRSKLGKPNEDKQSTTTNKSEAPKATQTNEDDSAIKSNVATAQSSEKNIFDFFASIEQEQTLIFGNQYNTGSFGRTSTNPFIAMQQQQQQQQQMVISQQALLQQQMSQLTLQQPPLQQSTVIPDTNPFRTSVFASPVTLPAASSNFNPFQSQIQQQNLLTPTNPFTTMNHSSSLQPLKTEDNNPFRRLSSASNFDSMQPFSPLQQQQSLNTTLGGNSSSTTSFAHIQSASNVFGAGF